MSTDKFYTYDQAPDSPELAGTGVTKRMLRRLVEARRISHKKFGQRVVFSTTDLREYVDRATVRAIDG